MISMCSMCLLKSSFFRNFNFILIFIFFLDLFRYELFADSAENWQVEFQDSASPIMDGIVTLYQDLFFIAFLILGIVMWILFCIAKQYDVTSPRTTEWHMSDRVIMILEFLWVLIPALLLVGVMSSSLAILYSIDEIIDPVLTLKVIGHQWYWSYEYSDYTVVNLPTDVSFLFDSYLIGDDDLQEGSFRLLEVDKRIILPIYTNIRAIVTSTDVLHSWALPSLGIKIDACPGRLNQVLVFIDRPGVYYGQCSEICGINHGFMPIALEAVPFKEYVSWIFFKYVEDSNGELI